MVDYRETDRICELLCEEEGRISVIARGARRSRKRFGGALSLFVIGEATVRWSASSRGGGLASLERFDCLEDLAPGLTGDVVAMAHGSYILELARELWPEGQPDPACFRLVCAALKALAAGGPSPALLRSYELQLLAAVGLAPSVELCVACGREPPPDQTVAFNIPRGGIVCSSCHGPGSQLPPQVRRLMCTMAQIPLERTGSLTPGTAEARHVRDTMTGIVRHHIAKPLKSLQFILELRDEN